jgi:peroxiredoxin
MSKRLSQNLKAPDFELQDTKGNAIHLADYHGKQSVVLVLTRGFM